jgi:hypothetical protein
MKTSFSRISSPAARYHDGTLSDINISNISASGDVMSFSVGSAVVSVTARDRKIPVIVDDGAIMVTPANPDAGADGNRPALLIGPNPVARSAGKVIFYRQGKRVDDATLTIYDAAGNAVSKVKIADNVLVGADGNRPVRRMVAEWDLRDANGRLVPEGTYLVRGSVKTAAGKLEKVSAIVGVR